MPYQHANCTVFFLVLFSPNTEVVYFHLVFSISNMFMQGSPSLNGVFEAG